MLSAEQVTPIEEAGWFHTTRSPYLLLDGDFRVRAVNGAFELATEQPRKCLVGELLFDAFPGNPTDPDADSVAVVTRSLQTVFCSGTPHSLGMQRYDVPDRNNPGEFIFKVWTPVNSPIKFGGTTVAVLNHPEDVTSAVSAMGGLDRPLIGELHRAAAALGHQFPDVASDEVLGLLTHSHAVVRGTLGAPDLGRAATLARLRLEVRSGSPRSGSWSF